MVIIFVFYLLSCVWLLRPHGLSIGLSMQEYWSGLPFPSTGAFPYPPGSNLRLLHWFFTAEPPGKPQGYKMLCCVCAMLNCLGYVWLFGTLWTVATRLFCSWDFPGKNTGASCHALLPGIFLTQGSSPCHLLMSPALAGGFFTTSAPWEAPCLISNN